ncbi:hypothetical protein EV126DRAFT_152101 [Verticillium dahliae]|nr:hypothetical protein EV126DRAFT_152101 [Verticillium dahliae]
MNFHKRLYKSSDTSDGRGGSQTSRVAKGLVLSQSISCKGAATVDGPGYVIASLRAPPCISTARTVLSSLIRQTLDGCTKSKAKSTKETMGKRHAAAWCLALLWRGITCYRIANAFFVEKRSRSPARPGPALCEILDSVPVCKCGGPPFCLPCPKSRA